MRQKLPSSVKQLVLREKLRFPHLGVRQIAAILKEKHNVILSKSAVNNILVNKGMREKKGRKQTLLSYKAKEIDNAQALLVRLADSQAGIFDAAVENLKPLFNEIPPDELKKIIILASLASYLDKDLKTFIPGKSLLRIAGLAAFPVGKFSLFIEKLAKEKPTLDLKDAAKELNPVSAVKLTFSNGSVSYCDPNLTTLWKTNCFIESLWLPLCMARRRLERMLSKNILAINYTKSFDAFSSEAISFISGVSSGLVKAEFLDPKGEVSAQIKPDAAKLDVAIGYYPKGLSKAIVFLDKSRAWKRFIGPGAEFFYAALLSRIVGAKDKKGLILSNVILNRRKKSLPEWGILTTKKDAPLQVIAKYLYFWPQAEKNFLDEMAAVEKFFLKHTTVKNDEVFFPSHIKLEKPPMLAGISTILFDFLNSRVSGLKNQNYSAQISSSGDSLKVAIKGLPAPVKKDLNKNWFYWNNRKVFFI